MDRRTFSTLISAISIITIMLITPLGYADETVYGYQLMTEQ